LNGAAQLETESRDISNSAMMYGRISSLAFSIIVCISLSSQRGKVPSSRLSTGDVTSNFAKSQR